MDKGKVNGPIINPENNPINGNIQNQEQKPNVSFTGAVTGYNYRCSASELFGKQLS